METYSLYMEFIMPTQLASTVKARRAAPVKRSPTAPRTVIGELRKLLAGLVGL
jgi:hypothetical protein